MDNHTNSNCKSCLPKMIIFEEFSISKCPDGCPGVSNPILMMSDGDSLGPAGAQIRDFSEV